MYDLSYFPRDSELWQLILTMCLGKQILTKFAYVRQEDLFFSQLTVRETLSLATEVQLPSISSAEERDEYVINLLFKLALVSCADTNVGDAKVHGISGGEKKRLSMACELLASPSVVFADEPKTGFQCFDAYAMTCSLSATRCLRTPP